jgi:hypothetical protein
LSVKDHGLDAIRKSTIVSPTEGDPTEYCIRVCQDGEVTITGTIGGSVQLQGFSTTWKNTTLNVSTTALPLPSTALTGRNAIAIRNLDPSVTLYIGNFDVVANDAIGTTAGWQIGPNETYNLGITDSVVLYGVVASGTIRISVKELA